MNSSKSASRVVKSVGRRWFSLRQANRALVLIRRVVADILKEYSAVLELQEILEAQQRHGRIEDLDRVRQEMSRVVTRLQGYLEELGEIGVELRDFSCGVVDFPAFVAGRQVCFCWQYGEDGIGFWHDSNDCQAGRRPLAELIEQPLPAGK